MRALRSLATLASVVVLSFSVLAGCGGDDGGDGGDGGDTGDDPTQTSSTTEGIAPTTDAGSDGEPAEETSSVSFADCSAISADEMGAVLGEGTATAEVPPASSLCAYALDDPRQPSVTIEQFTTADFADGWDGARSNITNTALGPLDGTPQAVSAGDDAVVLVAPSQGGSSLQSIGLVLVGDTIVRASVLQAIDLDEQALTTLTTDVLALVATKAG